MKFLAFLFVGSLAACWYFESWWSMLGFLGYAAGEAHKAYDARRLRAALLDELGMDR